MEKKYVTNDKIIKFIKNLYPHNDFVPLHQPLFMGNEKKYVNDCIDSTYVSSVGQYVNKLESMVMDYTGAKYAVAVVNGTAALHMTLLLSDANKTEVLTPTITFIGTVNAIKHAGAEPLFLDSEKQSLGICPEKLSHFLKNNCYMKQGYTYNKKTNKRISACILVHIFGNPAQVETIKDICKQYKVSLIEDAAESLGSFYKKQHLGTFGKLGIYSFNGNKIITSGGGGIIVTNDERLGKLAKHLTNTAKVPHKYKYFHNQVAYNYRLPNINAALACAQMENLEKLVLNKRKITAKYKNFFSNSNIEFIEEIEQSRSNCWLNAILFETAEKKSAFLEEAHAKNIGARPLWEPINTLPMYKNHESTDLTNAMDLAKKLVNIPSSPILDLD